MLLNTLQSPDQLVQQSYPAQCISNTELEKPCVALWRNFYNFLSTYFFTANSSIDDLQFPKHCSCAQTLKTPWCYRWSRFLKGHFCLGGGGEGWKVYNYVGCFGTMGNWRARDLVPSGLPGGISRPVNIEKMFLKKLSNYKFSHLCRKLEKVNSASIL